MQVEQGTDVITFGYDVFNRRVWKNVNGTVTRFVWLGHDLAVEADAYWNVTATYFYAPGVDMPISRTTSGGTIYYLQDHAGSVSALTNASGGLIGRYHYTPWGEVVSADSGLPAQPLLWTARELDETGLYYLRGRYYHPGIGRFLSEDPIGLDGGLNLYAFGMNHPVGMRDPFGEEPKRFLMGGGGSSCPPSVLGGGKTNLDVGPYDASEHWDDIVATDTILRHHFLGLHNTERWGEMQDARRVIDPSLGPADPNVGPPGTMILEDVYTPAIIGAAGGAARIPGNPFRGKGAATDAFKHLQRYHGLDPNVASRRRHAIKKWYGFGPADDLVIGRTGCVYNPKTGALLGKLTDNVWGY